MEEGLTHAIKIAVVIINGIAAAFLFIGAVQVCIRGLIVMLIPSTPNSEKRAVWLQFSQWLVVGLTIQLAADILESSIMPSWEEIGKLAAIAVIRTFLNYFLENDMSEIRERNQKKDVPSLDSNVVGG